MPFLSKTATPQVHSCIAEHLDNPSTSYDALEEVNKHYGQSYVVARSHLMELINLQSMIDDDSQAEAKLKRTLHGAMHAPRIGGNE